MYRNMKKAIEQGNNIAEARPGLSLRLTEVKELLDVYDDHGGRDLNAAWYLMEAAYYSGLAVGMRNA